MVPTKHPWPRGDKIRAQLESRLDEVLAILRAAAEPIYAGEITKRFWPNAGKPAKGIFNLKLFGETEIMLKGLASKGLVREVIPSDLPVGGGFYPSKWEYVSGR